MVAAPSLAGNSSYSQFPAAVLHRGSILYFLASASLSRFSLILECERALGMENGEISDGQITASSAFDERHRASLGRLHHKESTIPELKSGGWVSRLRDSNQWLQIDLDNQHTTVTRIATQGRNSHSQWPGAAESNFVTKYKLQYRNGSVKFHYFVEQGQSADKVR